MIFPGLNGWRLLNPRIWVIQNRGAHHLRDHTKEHQMMMPCHAGHADELVRGIFPNYKAIYIDFLMPRLCVHCIAGWVVKRYLTVELDY